MSKEGEEQIERLRDILKEFNIKFVWVSPLKRAVRTALEALKLHPNFKEIKFFIMPWLKSKVQELMDLPSLSLEELLKEFADSYPEAHISVQFEGIVIILLYTKVPYFNYLEKNEFS